MSLKVDKKLRRPSIKVDKGKITGAPRKNIKWMARKSVRVAKWTTTCLEELPTPQVRTSKLSMMKEASNCLIKCKRSIKTSQKA